MSSMLSGLIRKQAGCWELLFASFEQGRFLLQHAPLLIGTLQQEAALLKAGEEQEAVRNTLDQLAGKELETITLDNAKQWQRLLQALGEYHATCRCTGCGLLERTGAGKRLPESAALNQSVSSFGLSGSSFFDLTGLLKMSCKISSFVAGHSA